MTLQEPHPHCRPTPARQRGGFTLLELLIATAITTILVFFLMNVAQGILNGYARTHSVIIRSGDVTFALDQLITDLECLVIPNAPGAEGLRLSLETVGNANNVPWLTFLSAAVDNDNSTPQNVNGATRAVSYRLAKKPAIDSDPFSPEIYALYRSIASSAHTFDNALDKTNLQDDYWNTLPATPLPTPQPPTATGNLLAENIIGFSVLFQYLDSGGNLVWTQSNDLVSIRRDGTYLNSSPLPSGFLRAQVTVTAISPEGAKRLETGMPFAEVVERYATTVTRQTSFF